MVNVSKINTRHTILSLKKVEWNCNEMCCLEKISEGSLKIGNTLKKKIVLHRIL